MSAEKKREAALKMVRSVGRDSGYDESLVTDDFTYWAHNVGTLKGAKIKELFTGLRHIIPKVPELDIIGTTVDGDRVAIEANGDCMLSNGVRYRNSYHWVVLFRGDKICYLKEYYDSKYARECVGAALDAIPRGPA
jgi:ketosteroid isomerase-like protein